MSLIRNTVKIAGAGLLLAFAIDASAQVVVQRPIVIERTTVVRQPVVVRQHAYRNHGPRHHGPRHRKHHRVVVQQPVIIRR